MGLPPGTTYRRVDFDSLSSLSNALEGQDAFVSTIDKIPLQTQLLLVEAAARAHVKRFIPHVSSANILDEKLRGLPCFGDTVGVHDALEKVAASGGMTYSIMCTGPILDFEIRMGNFMDLRQKTIKLFDGGNRVFSTTSSPTIGKAITGVFTHPEETKNRVLYVQDTATTLQRLAAMGEKVTGANGWSKTVVSVDEIRDYQFYLAACFAEGYGSHFEKNDNELLGLQEMSDAEVQELVYQMTLFS